MNIYSYMNCQLASKKKQNGTCIYCMYPDITTPVSRQESVQKLQKMRTSLTKKLLCIEKQLLNPMSKGGEKYASI